jgi:hypothetical protein
MIRTILVASAVLFAAGPLFVSPAAACISCEYTPEVVNTPVPGAKKHRKKAVAKERPAPKRPAKREIAAPKPVEPEETYTAAKKPVSAPTEPAAGTQPNTGSPAVAAAPTPTGSEPAKPIEEAKAPDDVGCKRFSPTAGTTVPVPCN